MVSFSFLKGGIDTSCGFLKTTSIFLQLLFLQLIKILGSKVEYVHPNGLHPWERAVYKVGDTVNGPTVPEQVSEYHSGTVAWYGNSNCSG